MPTNVDHAAAHGATGKTRGTFTLLRSSIVAAMACIGVFDASTVCANGFHVSSCADDGGATTLRTVIGGANDGDYIFLDQLPLTCSKITLTTGAIEIGVPSLTIEGVNGRDIDISAGSASRVFHHTGAGTLELKYLQVSDGYYKASVARGGCIYSAGNVTLFANDDVSNCSAIGIYTPGDASSGEAKGGGIFTAGELTVNSSRVTHGYCRGTSPYESLRPMGGNLYTAGGLSMKYSEVSYGTAGFSYTTSVGGGIASRSVDGIAIKSSLIVGNYAFFGGGIYASSSDAQVPNGIENSTIFANSAVEAVAGIYIAAGNTTIKNSTVALNRGGSGLYTKAQLSLTSTIVSGNYIYDVEVKPGITIAGDHNLIGTADADVPIDTLRSDPLFGPYQHNGGKPSLGLLPGSPAIDAGSNEDNLVYDQRGAGHPRILGLSTDIGSFEVDPDRIFASEFE
jgi:hypothetical protein